MDTEISNREPQDEEEKDEGEKHVDTEISNSEPQDEKEKDKGDLEEPETRDTKDPRRERQAPRMEPKEKHVIRTRSGEYLDGQTIIELIKGDVVVDWDMYAHALGGLIGVRV